MPADRSDPSVRTARFLKTSHKTCGKRERQETLFPDLVKEIESERAKAKGEIKRPDQDTETYKDEAERVASGLLGPQLLQRQRRSFLTKVVRAFS